MLLRALRGYSTQEFTDYLIEQKVSTTEYDLRRYF